MPKFDDVTNSFCSSGGGAFVQVEWRDSSSGGAFVRVEWRDSSSGGAFVRVEWLRVEWRGVTRAEALE